MKKLQTMYVCICIAVLVAVAGCGRNQGNNSKEEKEKDPAVPVEVAEVISGDIAAYFTGTATIEAEEETEVVAKVGGVVERIMVEEGDYVEAGDVLASLDDEMLKVQVEQAEASLKGLESDYERNKKLHQKELVSTEEFQQSKYEYEQQKAVYDLAVLSLKYATIRTPISGVVAERKIKVGNMVLQNSPTFRVTGMNPLIAVPKAALFVPGKTNELIKIPMIATAPIGSGLAIIPTMVATNTASRFHASASTPAGGGIR